MAGPHHPWHRDPSKEEERQRQAAIEVEKRRQKHTFEAALETYIKRKAKLRTIHVAERELRRECKDWLKLPIQDINQAKVKELITSIVDERGKLTQARAIFALIRGFFSWCVDTGDYGLEAHPFEKPIKLKADTLIGAPNRRKRTLKDYEIEAYWRSSIKLGYPFGTVFQLLLLAAVRLNEVAEAEWPEVGGEAGLWIIPAERMKGEEEEAVAHAVPLVPDIAALFQSLPRFKRDDKSDFIFSTTGGRRPISGFSKKKKELDTLMKADLGVAFEPFVLHDIRRTCRTRFSSLPIEDIVRERLLAHVQQGDRKSYDHHDYLDEKANALRLWHAKLKTIVEPPAPNVTQVGVNA
jgi:hypothetical protein